MTLRDVYDLTPQQLEMCRDYAEKQGLVFADG